MSELHVNTPNAHNGSVLFLQGVSDVQSSTNKSTQGGIVTSATAGVTSEFRAITEQLWQTDDSVLPLGSSLLSLPPLLC